jgi:hypothetical protein
VAACKLPEGTQLVGMMQGKKSQTGIVHFKDYAAHVIKIGDIAAGKRTKVGQELVAVKPGDKVVGLSTMIEMATGEGKEGKTEQGRGKSGKKPRRRK